MGERIVMDTNQLLVVIEKGFADARRELDERFSKVDERFSKVDERFSKVDEHFSKVDEHFSALRSELDEHFERIDERFDQVDRRFAKVDERFDQVGRRFAKVDDYAGQTKMLVEDLRDKLKFVDDMPEPLAKRVSALEVRLTKVEKRRK